MPDIVSLPGPARGNFSVPDATLLPWSKLAAGTWEPYTFELMDELLGPREWDVWCVNCSRLGKSGSRSPGKIRA